MAWKWRVGAITLIAFLCSACGKEGNHDHANDEQHGTPKDWKFTLTKGNPDEGKKVFVELECYKCHEVKGERFADVAQTDKGVGPELSQMAGSHPIEFFAESIINPNAVIDDDAKERGYVSDDGKSKMPDYTDVISVKQLADLSTYLASLKPGGTAHH
jgi:mono/diheme cytochrome c family protein